MVRFAEAPSRKGAGYFVSNQPQTQAPRKKSKSETKSDSATGRKLDAP